MNLNYLKRDIQLVINGSMAYATVQKNNAETILGDINALEDRIKELEERLNKINALSSKQD